VHRTIPLEKPTLTALGQAIEAVGRLVGQLGEAPANDAEKPDKPVTTLEASQALGVSTRSLIRWEQQGCPSIRTGGGKRRWDLVAVKQWLDARGGDQ
jgi:hypothetical protein